jgi:hypothetical protein
MVNRVTVGVESCHLPPECIPAIQVGIADMQYVVRQPSSLLRKSKALKGQQPPGLASNGTASLPKSLRLTPVLVASAGRGPYPGSTWIDGVPGTKNIRRVCVKSNDSVRCVHHK